MKLLHTLSHHLGPRFDHQRRPVTNAAAQPATRWLILQQGANPSSDYYIRPQVTQSGLPATWRHIDTDAPRAEDLAPGTRVVIVRYLTPAWAQALHKHRSALADIIYFLDDDLLNPAVWTSLPDTYRKKLRRYCQQMYPHIQALATRYWASTPVLCQRYPAQAMQHIAPQPLAGDYARSPVTPQADQPVQVFYHGSAAHMDEIRWLRPIIGEVLAACPRIHFEIIGDQQVNRLYRDLPRTRVLHPMSWPNYLAHCRTLNGHIGLAPLLPGAFNETRSYVKAFDIARCAAVGIYSANSIFNAASGHAGALFAAHADSQSWEAQITKLATQVGPP